MADENNQAPQNPVAETQPKETQQETAAEAKEQAAEIKDTWKGVVGDKYKSPEELAKAYKDLETKLGQQSEEVRRSKEFQTVVRPILEEIRKDPKIFEALDKRLRNESEPDNLQSENAKDAKENTDESREAVSDMIRLNFEKKYGIDKLSPEEAAETRRKIGEAIVDLTGRSFNQVDLRQLEKVLDNAYQLQSVWGLPEINTFLVRKNDERR